MNLFPKSHDALVKIEDWLYAQPLGEFFHEFPLFWPWNETLHYIGLAMLFSSVIIFDLRILGFMKSLSPALLHRLIPIGVAGFGLNLMTGSLFLTHSADQYIRNSAFQIKFLCMMLAGVNVVIFYLYAWPKLKEAAMIDDETIKNAPDHVINISWRIKTFALISLLAWTGVVVGGRLITFYRPSF